MEVEEKGRGLIFKILSQHFPGGTEEYHENFRQDSQPPDRNLNPGSSKYEAVLFGC
jgi:hypothetical protein